MKEIIKGTFNGGIFNNFFRFIKNKVNDKDEKNDAAFLSEFNKKMRETTKASLIESENQFKITEKNINEQAQSYESKIIIPELEDTQITKNREKPLTKEDYEEYQRYKKDKFKKISEVDKYGYNKNEIEKDNNLKKERKLPKNVKRALDGEKMSLPIFERENRMLKEIQKEKDSSRIAV